MPHSDFYVPPPPWRWEQIAVPENIVYTYPGDAYSDAYSRITASDYLRNLKALLKWARKNDIGLEFVENKRLYSRRWYGGISGPVKFRAILDSPELNDKWAPLAELTTIIGSRCTSCTSLGYKTHVVNGRRFCVNCVRLCECGNALGEEYVYSQDGSYAIQSHCTVCRPISSCESCATTMYLEDLGVYNNEPYNDEHFLCNHCGQYAFCRRCNRLRLEEIVNIAEVRISEGVLPPEECITCRTADVRNRLSDSLQENMSDELPRGGMLIPSRPDRPNRVISIETEVNGDRQTISALLYQQGLIEAARTARYGENVNLDSPYPVHMKHDGTVTGGELLTWLIELNNPDHANSLSEVLKTLRCMEKAQLLEHSYNAGGHIHVDAHGLDDKDIWRLSLVFGYLETPIYLLAGAGSPYGHRSMQGNAYATHTTKGPFGSSEAAYSAIVRQRRGSALNFKCYYDAYSRCQCGETAKNCICQLPKCTIEWRVWNSQSNPRILHGWLAFMQAVHAYCESDEHFDEDDEEKYPAWEWNAGRWLEGSDRRNKPSNRMSKRLNFIFNELPLEANEKDSLVYAFMQTPIGAAYGNEYLHRLARFSTPVLTAKRATIPRVCRRVPIAIQPKAIDNLEIVPEDEEVEFDWNPDDEYPEDNWPEGDDN
jgi:hypothetical protein